MGQLLDHQLDTNLTRSTALGTNNMTDTRLAQIQAPLRWAKHPASFEVTPHDHLVIQAGPHTDLFRDPLGTQEHQNAPRLLFSLAPEYVLSARVTVDFADVFDAGVLMVYATDAGYVALPSSSSSPDPGPNITRSICVRRQGATTNSAA